MICSSHLKTASIASYYHCTQNQLSALSVVRQRVHVHIKWMLRSPVGVLRYCTCLKAPPVFYMATLWHTIESVEGSLVLRQLPWNRSDLFQSFKDSFDCFLFTLHSAVRLGSLTLITVLINLLCFIYSWIKECSCYLVGFILVAQCAFVLNKVSLHVPYSFKIFTFCTHWTFDLLKFELVTLH